MTIQKLFSSILQSVWNQVRRFKTVRRLENWLFSLLKPEPVQLRVREEIDTIDLKVPSHQTESLKVAAGVDIQVPAPPPVTPLPPSALKVQNEIDFHGLENLEAYLEGTTVTQETLHKWVAAGILSPQETRVAEKLIKLMRKNTQAQAEGGDRSRLS